jgi:hypothetical protein
LSRPLAPLMPASDALEVADTLVALAYTKVRMSEIDAAILLMKEALENRRARFGPTDKVVLDTKERLALLRVVASG